MASPCGGDPVLCIDFVALFIAEYLGDWTTLVLLTLLLVLLLMLRAGRQQAADDAYARQLEAYADKRSGEIRTRN